MKHTRPEALLTPELLRFVRDLRPSAKDFEERLGTQCFHILRKHAVLVIEGDLVRLNRQHLSPDGRHFVWGALVFCLDGDEVLRVCYEGGPPIFASEL